MSEGIPYEEDNASELAREVFGGKLSIGEALEKLRTRLLDLTMRNKLLNYRPPKGRAFQFTNDPDLNLLYERLEEGRAVALAYVPEPPPARYQTGRKPDAKAYARELGIGTSIDIAPPAPATAYRRLPALQVLQYPADLERTARKIASEAHTVVEETGTNMLYLMFGYLEYFDSEDSERAVHAPLLSMPITLTKGNIDPESRTYVYEVSYSGEDINENFTLREKLRQQFRLELPELMDESSPEQYFEQIQAAVAKRKNWVVRRRLSLGFLSFGKLAIWADLDPAKSETLLSGELLRNIFEGGASSQDGGFHAEDYVIDCHEDAELPLIYDADSSQHSAIIDVKAGKNLVINGPPGTGKSQTITNIVAAAIAAGKKVLFVSEKLAALEVVKQRLEKAGLGDFCLELHSHKTQKKQLLEGIEQRLAKRYAHPAGYSNRIDVLRERKKSLNAYAGLLGSRLGNALDLTVHEVLWTAEWRRQSLGQNVERIAGIVLPGAADWRAEQVDRCRNTLGDAASAIDELGCAPPDSPWLGFSPGLLVKDDEFAIEKLVANAHEHVSRLEQSASGLRDLLGGEAWSNEELQRAQSAVDVLRAVPAMLNGEVLAMMYAGGLKQAGHVAAEVGRLSAMLAQTRELLAKADQALVTCDHINGDRLEDLASTGGAALLDAALVKTPSELTESVSQMRYALEDLEARLDGRPCLLPPKPSILAGELKAACEHSALAAWSAVKAVDLLKAADAAVSIVAEVKHSLGRVQDLLQKCRIPFNGHVDEIHALLDGRGMPDLLPSKPHDEAMLEQLLKLAEAGYGDWTAQRFLSEATKLSGQLAKARLAAEELRLLGGRLGISLELTGGAIEALEVLLKAAEAAPKDLLAFRGPGLERSDFADIAIRAEDAHRSVVRMATKVAAAFHLDALPEDGTLRGHIRALRRNDSLFNIFNGDWRKARRAFRECCRSDTRLKSREMAERFGTVLNWRNSHNEFVGHEHFSSVLGVLFQGLETDFSRVRRINEWLTAHEPLIVSSEFNSRINLNTMPEASLIQLAGGASKARGWIADLVSLNQATSALPGLDPALARVRRFDDLFEPLSAHASLLEQAASTLRVSLRPTATVSRGVELIQLQSRLAAHGDLLQSLVGAPARLMDAANRLSLPTSPLSFQNIVAAASDLGDRARLAHSLAQKVILGLDPELSARDGVAILEALTDSTRSCVGVVRGVGVPNEGPVARLVVARRLILEQVSEFVSYLLPFGRSGTSMQEVQSGLRAALDAAKFLKRIEDDESFRGLFGAHLRGADTDERIFRTCCDWVLNLRSVLSLLPLATRERFVASDAPTVAQATASLISSAGASWSAYRHAMEDLRKWGGFNWDLWGGGVSPAEAVERLNRALGASDRLVSWSKYLAAREDSAKLGVGEILGRAESGKVKSSELVAAFEYVFFRNLSRGILASHRELGRFTGAGHERLRAEFAALDKELISLNGAMYAAKVDGAKKTFPGVSSGRAGDVTEMPLLTKELKKQKRHVPIRQLLKRAGRTLQELKPCFMMGPLSVAQYLEQGHLKFDLVVMDEASQLRPEDALGAIARGTQLVVVGDPKQLPPTNFFDKLMDADDEDPDDAPAVVDGVESILGICEHIYRPVRTLRWHYRSRHESLIAFSNRYFYDGRLVVFPSPYKRNRRLGVNYRYVENAEYQDRRNLREAERVVEAVMYHMQHCPEESLGVVTLNQTQRELIEDLLDKRIRDVAGVAEYMERHNKEGWGFFVKNLENVQGDERDVIFVSTTFGKPPGSSAVRQNFGPINRPDGWRRLNVLFTRARRRIDLFTSMRPSDVIVDEKASLGRRALRDYLEYAYTGILPMTADTSSEREPDSDFELAVAEALRSRNYNVVCQVGVAGYFIDLGVRHPKRVTEYLAGIECDGATYHSSLSARDRDRIRQEILESLGWRGRIIRIWSTDWFSDPVAQTDRIVRFLEQRELEDDSQVAPYSDEHVEGSELGESVETSTSPAPTLPPSVLVHPPDDEHPGSQAVLTLFVDIGDRVTYESSARPPERHTVQIVDSPSNLRLGLLNERTPLAQALLGLCEGDEAEVKVKDQPTRAVRILKIVRFTQDEPMPRE